jgi:hypothetical protein
MEMPRVAKIDNSKTNLEKTQTVNKQERHKGSGKLMKNQIKTKNQ